jgi:ribosomal-protein-alanine N-acetyltransferase
VIVLRAAHADDVDAIAEIERAVFNDPWSPASFAGLLTPANAARVRMTVAMDGPRLVGYSVLLFAGPDADLANLAVAPMARRRGIGTQLLHGAVTLARSGGVEHLYLEVRASNAHAIAMYEHAGFQVFGLRRRYYREPVEDARVLRLDVASH